MLSAVDSSIDVFDAISLKEHQRTRAAKAWVKGTKARQHKLSKYTKDPVERERLLALQQRRLKKRGSDDEDSDILSLDDTDAEEAHQPCTDKDASEEEDEVHQREDTEPRGRRSRGHSCSRTQRNTSAGSDSDASTSSTRQRRGSKADQKTKNTDNKGKLGDVSDIEQALRSKKRANRRGNDDELIEQLEKLEAEAAAAATAAATAASKATMEATEQPSQQDSDSCAVQQQEEKIVFQHNVHFSTKDQTMAAQPITLGEWRAVVEKKLDTKSR